jgi:DNA-binding response OmpR family regulator
MMTDIKPATVLVIESDPLLRDLIILALKRGAYAPLVCAEPRDARRLVIENQPAVVLVDLYLTGTNGLDLIRELNHDNLLAHRIVIAISALSFPEIITQTIQAGAADFLVKPFTADLLLSRIQRLLNR